MKRNPVAVHVYVFDTHEVRIPDSLVAEVVFRKDGRPDRRASVKNKRFYEWAKKVGARA